MRYVVKACKSPEELAVAVKGFSLDADLRKNVAANVGWSYYYAEKVLEVVVPDAADPEKDKADPIKGKLSAFGLVEVGEDA